MKKIIIIEDTDDLFTVADKIDLVINLNNMSISIEKQKPFEELDGIKHRTVEKFEFSKDISLKDVISEGLKNARIRGVRFVETKAPPLTSRNYTGSKLN